MMPPSVSHASALPWSRIQQHFSRQIFQNSRGTEIINTFATNSALTDASNCPYDSFPSIGAVRSFSGGPRPKKPRRFKDRKEMPRRTSRRGDNLSIIRRRPRSAKKITSVDEDSQTSPKRASKGRYDPRAQSRYSSARGSNNARETRFEKINVHKTAKMDEGGRLKSEDFDLAESSDSLEPKRMFREDWLNLKRVHQTKATSSGIARGSQKRGFDQKKQLGKIENVLRSGKSTRAAVTSEERASLVESFPPQNLDAFVSCLPGLEPILAEEIRNILGFDCKVEAGGVTPTTKLTTEDLLMCNMQIGTASHVLVRCGPPFTARSVQEMRRKVAALPWYQFLKQGTHLQVRVSSKKSKLNHSTAIRAALIEGINDAFLSGNDYAKGASVFRATEETPDALHMLVRIERDEVYISADSSKTPLHRRGYRLETAKAPLREDLAYAMLYSAGWRRYDPDNTGGTRNTIITFFSLLDPFCGSGTIAIEGASILHGLPPGRLRDPPFSGTTMYSPKKWRQRLGKLMRRIKRETGEENSLASRFKISASDRDEGAIDAARSNAERAGVEDLIDFRCLPLSDHPWLKVSTHDHPPYPLLITTNPPFGLRIAADKKSSSSRVHPLLPLYQTLMERQRLLNNATGGKVSCMTLLQDPNLFRRTGADFQVKFSSQHGGVPVAAVITNDQRLTKQD